MVSFLSKLFAWFCYFSKSPEDSDSIVGKHDVNKGGSDIRIGAFDCNKFGKNKFSKEDVVNHYYKILSRYHLILLQDIQDEDLNFIPDFVDGLNRYTGTSYKYKLSEPLGRKSHKEQYLYLYRDAMFTQMDEYLFDDGSEEDGNDTFEREPFIIKFRSHKTEVEEFAIIGAHLFYKAVEQELDELVNVHDDLVKRWGNIPVLIMGDFLAGGQYLSKEKCNKCKLKKDTKFHWVIDGIDTTALKNEYTYDRIIVVGDELRASIVEDSPAAFRFDDEFGLDTNKAKQVSDHYPVEFLMRRKQANNGINKIEEERKPYGNVNIEDIVPNIQMLGITDDDKQTVRIGSFNVRRFSSKKMIDPFVRKYLFKILGRYDFVFVQEVQVKEHGEMDTIEEFVNQLNRATGQDYVYIVTDRLGRKRYKEQYLYIYRQDIFQVLDQFVYDDGSEEDGDDTFHREPFVVLLKSTKCSIKRFAIIGCHIAPKFVEQEMEELVNVHHEVRAKWGHDCPVVLMGDFNADGSYLGKRRKKSLELWRDESYHWLLDNTDTTVAKSDNNYDRMIVCGEELFRRVHSSGAYRFDAEFGLSLDDAQKISDHYPVEFVIGGVSPKDEL